MLRAPPSCFAALLLLLLPVAEAAAEEDAAVTAGPQLTAPPPPPRDDTESSWDTEEPPAARRGQPAAAAAKPTPAPAYRGPPGSFLGPTMNFCLLAFPLPRSEPLVIGAPSLRGGVRFALLGRSAESYSLNLSASLQVGLEGIRRDAVAPLYAFGATAKVGLVGVTRGGPFMPFADAYLFFTVATRRVQRESLVFPRFGAGLNANLFNVVPSEWKPRLSYWWSDRYVLAFFFLTLLDVELVLTPANPLNPALTTELRWGFGF